MPGDIDALVSIQLQHCGLNVDLDVIHRPGPALRVIAAHPESLQHYDAAIVIGGPAPRRSLTSRS